MCSCSVDMWHPCPGCSVEVFRTQHLVMQQKHSTFSSDFSTSSPPMGTMREQQAYKGFIPAISVGQSSVLD